MGSELPSERQAKTLIRLGVSRLILGFVMLYGLQLILPEAGDTTADRTVKRRSITHFFVEFVNRSV